MAARTLPKKFRSQLPTLHGGAVPYENIAPARQDVPEPTPSAELVAEITLVPERSQEPAEDIPPAPPSIENFIPLWEAAIAAPAPDSAPLLRMVDTFSEDEFDPLALERPKPPSRRALRRRALAWEHASQKRADSSEDSVSEDSVSEDSVSEDSVSEDSVSEDSVSEDSVSEDSVGTTTQEDLPPVTSSNPSSIAPVSMDPASLQEAAHSQQARATRPPRNWLGYSLAAAAAALVVVTGVAVQRDRVTASAVDALSAAVASHGSAVALVAHAELADAAATDERPAEPRANDDRPQTRLPRRSAELRVRGNGCELWVDGQSHGLKDVVVLEVVPGQHGVGCRRDGRMRTARITATRGQTSVVSF